MRIKAGDIVLINNCGGEEYKVDDREYSVIREDDILALLKE
jgi:co-chaperonin GroES (HSP10)